MTTRVGFEFEFFSDFDQYDIEDHLVEIFGMKLGCEFEVVWDSSLRRNSESKGLYAHEIITPPFKKTQAVNVLKEINQYLKNIDAKFNKSTGFHINISTADMDRIDPRILLACSDDYFIAKYFNRHKNVYCRTWKENIQILADEAEKEHTSLKKEFDNLVSCFYNKQITSKVVKQAYKKVDPKYSSINIGKLKELKYVEYRMIGGPEYIDHEIEILDSIEHFIEGQSKAKNKLNTNRIIPYLEWATS